MHVNRESALKTDREKNPLPHWGVESASVLCLAFHSAALAIELTLPPKTKCLNFHLSKSGMGKLSSLGEYFHENGSQVRKHEITEYNTDKVSDPRLNIAALCSEMQHMIKL